MSSAVRIREMAPGERLGPFLDVAWTYNAADPQWVAPLRMVLETVLNPRKHPFHHHAAVQLFLAERAGAVVGRIAATVNRLHNETHGDRTGFFGLFECEDDPATARALLDAAAEWLRAQGMESMQGPMNLSTNEEISSPGILVDGFDTPPYITMSHNPRYYAGLMDAAGMTKCKDLLAYHIPRNDVPERLQRGVDAILRRHGATVRPMEMKRFAQEAAVIKDVYNSAWSLNWGFVPFTDEEFDHVAKDMKQIVDPDLCLIAEADGQAVGFSLTLPDVNQALRHLPSGRLFPFGLFKFLWHKRKINRARVITLGFKPGYQHAGLGAAFYLKTFLNSQARGYREGEGSWILEDNWDMRHAMEKMGCYVYKTYRVYERAL
jgi:GNAT superfamily N-acetyltransferase